MASDFQYFLIGLPKIETENRRNMCHLFNVSMNDFKIPAYSSEKQVRSPQLAGNQNLSLQHHLPEPRAAQLYSNLGPHDGKAFGPVHQPVKVDILQHLRSASDGPASYNTEIVLLTGNW